jgi:hypothetical protein
VLAVGLFYLPLEAAVGLMDVPVGRECVVVGADGRGRDILTPLDDESSSYLNRNAIRRLMENVDGIAIWVNQKLRECGIAIRADEIDVGP